MESSHSSLEIPNKTPACTAAARLLAGPAGAREFTEGCALLRLEFAHYVRPQLRFLIIWGIAGICFDFTANLGMRDAGPQLYFREFFQALR